MRARRAWPINAAVVNRSDAAAVRIAARELRRDRRNLSLQLAVVLSLGFGAVAAFSYTNAATAARKQVVESTLPLTLDALTADLQQEFLRPVQFASSMAANSFLVDWLQQGEQPPGAIQTYLQRIQQQHGATTTFFVSEATGRYYHPTGLLKTVQATHSQDAWFYRLRSSPQPFEVNLDRDTADLRRHTVFVNYKLEADDGRFLGAVGLGYSTTVLGQLIRQTEQTHGIQVMFVTGDGRILLAPPGPNGAPQAATNTPKAAPLLAQQPGIGPRASRILGHRQASLSYRLNGREIFVRSRHIPELNWYLLVSTPLRLPEGFMLDALLPISLIAGLTLTVVLGLIFAITQRHQAKLEQIAFTDQLSGAFNRSAFPSLFHNLLANLQRSGRPLTLAMLDIDHFKTINDRFGHPAGDAVIRRVSEQIRTLTRPQDLLFRWGGEEFLVLLPDTDLGEGCGILQRIPQAMADAPVVCDGTQVIATLSIGITQVHAGDNGQEVLDRADRALYAAKSAGRNRIVSAH